MNVLHTFNGAGYKPREAFITCSLAFLKIIFFTKSHSITVAVSFGIKPFFDLSTFILPSAMAFAIWMAVFSKYWAVFCSGSPTPVKDNFWAIFMADNITK